MSQDRVDVTELPETQLKKSPTWLKTVDQSGTCARCGEHTSLLDPCCGVGVYFEGGLESYEDLWSEIEEELSEQAEAARSDSLEGE